MLNNQRIYNVIEVGKSTNIPTGGTRATWAHMSHIPNTYVNPFNLHKMMRSPTFTIQAWTSIFQWIGLGENLQENPIFNGKKHGSVNFPLNQYIEIWSFHSRSIPGTFQFNLRWRHVGVTHYL
jgi:hypothetical protein